MVRSTARAMQNIPHLNLSIETLRDEFFEVDVGLCGDVPVRGHRVFGPATFGFSPGLIWALLRGHRDLVHVHGIWMFHCAAVLAWSLIRRGKYIITPHGMLEKWIRQRSPNAKKIVSAIFHKQFLRRASCFQALTEKEIEDVRDVIGECKIRMVPNFVDIDKQHIAGNPPWWRNEFSGRDVYLYFGRIHEKKGCLELCEAWSRACKEQDMFRERSVLVFCGWIDQVPEFETELASLNQQLRNIFFAGPQYGAAKESTFSAASVLILPSKSEGLPVTVLEGWAHGKPVIMTQHCNLSFSFSEGAAIEVGEDAPSIAKTLLLFSQMPQQKREEVGARGRRLLETHFSRDAVVAQLHQMYKQMDLGAEGQH